MVYSAVLIQMTEKQQIWRYAAVGITVITLGAILFGAFSWGNSLQSFFERQFTADTPRDATKKPVRGSSEVVTISRVVDGDTIELTDGRKVRYLNMDTPESVKPNTPEQCYAKKAAKINQSLVGKSTITLVYDKQAYDRYDRLLALIFTNDAEKGDVSKSINAELVRQGAASVPGRTPATLELTHRRTSGKPAR